MLNISFPDKPIFKASQNHAEVKSFRVTTWRLLTSGHIKVDSANRPQRVQVVDQLQIGVLRIAAELLQRRHAALRRRVLEDAGIPWLVEHSCPPIVEVFEEGPGYEAALGAFVWSPFSLSDGPLWRLYGVRRGDGGSIGIVVHHFICDGDSANLLMRDLMVVYRSLLKRVPPPALRIEISYLDYLESMNRWFELPAVVSARRQIADSLVAVTCPADKAATEPSPPRFYFRLEAEVTQALRQRASALGTTLFTLLLAIQFQMLHVRAPCAAQMIKIVVNGRDARSLFWTPGYLADRLYVSVDVPAASAIDWVRLVQAAVLHARKRAFIRADVIQSDLENLGVILATPVFNFLPKASGATPLSGAALPQIRTVPPPEMTGADRLCAPYWLEIKDHDVSLDGHFRFTDKEAESFGPAFIEACRRFVDASSNVCSRQSALSGA